MKGLQVNATWQPREGYTPTEREARDHRALRGNLIFKNPSLELVEKPIPEPKDDEVLLKVGANGVCGSDTNFLGQTEDGYTRYSGHCKLPCIIGHEFSGEIVKTGKNVKKLRVGDYVAGQTMNWCGECDACRAGMFNQCENLEEIGFTLDGAYAEYVVAKEKYCFKIDALIKKYGDVKLALEVGALLDPYCVSYNGMFIRAGGFLPGGNVAVFGAGPIGLAAMSLARAAGAAKVIAFELTEARMELAKKMGADYVFSSKKLAEEGSSPSEVIMKLTDGLGADMLVEATEVPPVTLQEIEKAMAVKGKVVQIGITADKVELSPFNFQRKGCTFYGSVGAAGHGIWPAVINLMASDRIQPELMITGHFDVEHAADAIAEAKKGQGGKIMVTPNW